MTELDSQFSGLAKTASKLLALVPSNMYKKDVNLDLTELKTFYNDDLPTPDTLDQELGQWKHKFQFVECKPSNCYELSKIVIHNFFLTYLHFYK